MVAFVKAKEEFKHKKTLPGILYSDVIRLVSRKKKIKYSIKNSILIFQSCSVLRTERVVLG